MEVVRLISSLLNAVAALVEARGDRAAEEEAAMLAQEALKKFADARKFPNG